MGKARTTKMQTGQVDVTFIQFKADKSNIEEVHTFNAAVKGVGDKLYLDRGQVDPKTKEKKLINITPDDVVAIYPSSIHVFPGYSFFENHAVK